MRGRCMTWWLHILMLGAEERGPIADDEFWGIQRFFEDRLKTEAGRAAVSH